MSTQVRERYPRLGFLLNRPSFDALRFSPWEVVAAVLALLLLAVVIFYYFSSLRPARGRLREVKARYEAQQALLTANPASGSRQASKKEQIQQAKESLETFKNERLRPQVPGTIAILNEINALVKKNNVRLDSGINVEKGGSRQGEEERKVSRKKSAEEMLDAFPKRQVQFTVVGPYPNLRALVNEIDHSKQFVVMNTVNLASVDEERGQRRAKRESGSAGSAVSLSIGMTAYFRP